MDSNNWRPAQAEQPPPMDGGDWRNQLQADSRQKIVNKIMETLKRHLPVSGQEGLEELKKIAIRFEEKIYSAATSQSDYLRKISLKMLTMESKSQNTIPNAMPSNTAGVSRNPQDQVPSQNMQSQVHNQGQSVPLQMVATQPQARQQLLAQNMQNNLASAGMQTSASLPNSLPPVSGLPQNPMSNAAQNPNMQSISGISQNSIGNSMNQGVASNLFTNAQRQMQVRQQQIGSQQPQLSQNPQQYMYQQQQLQHPMVKQKLQQGGMQQPLMQTVMQQQQQPQQQQQQNMLQGNQLQSSQQPITQTSSVMQPSIISGMQQNQQSSIQQPSQSILQQHQQSVLRQQQQQQPQQNSVIQQTQMSQQTIMPSQQQQQLMGKQANVVNMQQNQLIGQQSNISDMQQQQQQQRMLGQQNSLPNHPSQQQTNHQNLQQQHLVGQQNLPNMQQQQLGHQNHAGGLAQQQQLVGAQSGTIGMQTNQHSVHVMQQSKVPGQQQSQSAASLLPGGGQQPQPQLQPQPQSQPQQQLMSQLQSHPTQLQQLALQQQQSSLQHNMQQRIQTPNPLLQQQNMIDQQKHLFQSQRAPPDAPSTSLESTAQTGGTNAGDWQEEFYQKIKAMKDLYFTELNEMYQKISIKLQQHDSLAQPAKIEQLDKLKLFKQMLEKLMHFLQTTKNNVSPVHREKFSSFERQIINLLNSHRPRKTVPSMQQGQILSSQLQTMQQSQQPHSQLPQAQSHDSGANPQLQSMNLQGSVPAIQQNNMSSLQHGSGPSLPAITTSQQSMVNSLQAGSNLGSGQGNAPNSMQQVAMASMQQIPASASQQANMATLQTQSGVNMLQQNINPLQSNSHMLQNQHLKQQQEQQMMQTQQLKHQLHSRQMQQQLLQKQQLIQQQQQQQLHLQAKQQQASSMQAHQMPQIHQINDVNDIKMRQGSGPRSGAFPQHLSSTQRYAHQQLKAGASFPISSPQLLQGMSPQVNQHSSPQVDQQNLPPSVPKCGTPLQSANSPFVPSPSTPLAPSPMPGDSEKPAVSSLSNTANIGSIGTPGISASPFLECTAVDGTHGNASTVSGKSSVTEQPLERLLKAVKSISPKALNASVSDIGSVVSMIDRIAGSAPGNGSRATVGEDLVAMTKCRLQARNFLTQDGSTGTKRMRRHTSAMPLNVASSVGSMSDSFKGLETSELESTATSSIKKTRIEVNHALLEEIKEINERLIDTVVDISDEDADPSVAASAALGSGGTIVRCCFSAITLSPNLKSQYTSAHMSPIQPLRLLVPANYPNCSPILLDQLPVQVSKDHEDLSLKAKSKFSISLRSLSQPMSLREIARTWDDCARAVISEYAQQNGGGTFSSKYGTWENCLSAA